MIMSAAIVSDSPARAHPGVEPVPVLGKVNVPKLVDGQAAATPNALALAAGTDRITYREQKIKGTAALLRGLVLFYAVCALGAVANVGVGSWVFDRTYIWWLAGVSGLIIGSVWNYTLSSFFVWSRRD